MDEITMFGFIAVTAMMIFDTLEKKHVAFTLCFAVACFAAATYGYLAAAYPMAFVEAFWGLMKLWHYHTDPRRKTP